MVGNLRRLENEKQFLHFGAKMAVFVYVTAQFINFDVFTIGSFVVSLQKLMAAVLFPLSAILIRRVYIPRGFFLLLVSFILTYSIGLVASPELVNEVISAELTLILNAIGAIVVISALASYDGSYEYLTKIWSIYTFLSSILVILQSTGILNQLAGFDFLTQFLSGEGGALRGTGFRTDPNFLVTVLVLGFIFTISRRSRFKLIILAVTFIGIFLTYSRMGILALLVFFSFYPLVANKGLRKVLESYMTILPLLALFLISFLLLYFYISPGVRTYFDIRLNETILTFKNIFSGTFFSSFFSEGLSSSDMRALLFWGSGRIILENWATGIGPFQTVLFMTSLLGISNVSHNTYLEFLLIGGVWGLFSMIIYFGFVVRNLRVKSGNNLNQVRKNIISICLLFLYFCLFLSLTYNSILWLPAILSASFFLKIKFSEE